MKGMDRTVQRCLSKWEKHPRRFVTKNPMDKLPKRSLVSKSVEKLLPADKDGLGH